MRAVFGANEWLVDELYEQYLKDKNAVDPAWWDFFEGYRPAPSPDASGTVGFALVPGPFRRLVDAARESGAQVVGLSCLLTTAFPAMQETIAAFASPLWASSETFVGAFAGGLRFEPRWVTSAEPLVPVWSIREALRAKSPAPSVP